MNVFPIFDVLKLTFHGVRPSRAINSHNDHINSYTKKKTDIRPIHSNLCYVECFRAFGSDLRSEKEKERCAHSRPARHYSTGYTFKRQKLSEKNNKSVGKVSL